MWISEQTAIISLYSINCLVFVTETECVYCAVRTGSLYIILRSAHTVYLCVLCGSENKQRFPYTALTDWFYNQDGLCLLRGTDWVFICNSTFIFVCKGFKGFTTSEMIPIPLAVWIKKQLRNVIGAKSRMVFSTEVLLGTQA